MDQGQPVSPNKVTERNLVNLFNKLEGYFSPKIIGEVNDVCIKIARIKGDDVPWHTHDNEDELFYIFSGSLVMQQENMEDIILKENEFYIVPRGVRHRVHTDEDCHVILIEHKNTKHTGNVASRITKSYEDQIR